MIIEDLHHPRKGLNMDFGLDLTFQGLNYISTIPFSQTDQSIESDITYQSLRDRHQALHINLILAQVKHFQSPVTLEHLRDVGNSRLDKNNHNQGQNDEINSPRARLNSL